MLYRVCWQAKPPEGDSGKVGQAKKRSVTEASAARCVLADAQCVCVCVCMCVCVCGATRVCGHVCVCVCVSHLHILWAS